MRRKKGSKPDRVDENAPFLPESIDDRIRRSFVGRDIHNTVFDTLYADGMIDIEGSGNTFRNIWARNQRRRFM